MDKFAIGLLGGFLASKVITPKDVEAVQEQFYAARSGGGSPATESTEISPLGGSGYLQDVNYGDRVYVDPTATGGTTYPAGTRRYPCKTLAEARTVAAAQGLNKYHLIGSFTLDADMTSVIFTADARPPFVAAAPSGALLLNGFSIDNSLCENIGVGNTAHAATVDSIVCVNCLCGFITNAIDLLAINCEFAQVTTLIDASAYIFNSWGGSNATPQTFQCAAGDVYLLGCVGHFQISGMTDAAASCEAHGDFFLTVAAGCTAGNIYAWDNVTVNGAGGGVTITDISHYANIGGLKTSRDRTRCRITPVGSALIEEVQLTSVAGDKALGSIVLNTIPAGATVTFAQVLFIYGAIENIGANPNKLNGAQNIQINKGGGAWTDAIAFPDDYFGIAGSTREGGNIIYGTINLSATVTGNDTYNFQWDEGVVDLDSLNFNNCQVLLMVEYSI